MPKSISILTSALLAGCTMIPSYTRPDLPVAEQWPGDSARKCGNKKISCSNFMGRIFPFRTYAQGDSYGSGK